MSGLLDTDIIVRYLTGEPANLFAQATELIEHDERLSVTDAALAEAAYVLSRVYRLPREAVVDSLMAFVRRQNIDTYGMEKALVLQCLLLCRPSGRVSYTDALIWAAARSSEEKAVYSQDERFPSDGIEVRRGRP